MPWQAFFKSRRNERRHEVDSPDVPLRAERRLTKRFALPPYFEQQQFIEAGIFRAWMRAETRHNAPRLARSEELMRKGFRRGFQRGLTRQENNPPRCWGSACIGARF